MPILIDLFLNFARIGLFTFGGGYAMIPLLEECCVEKKKWITHDDMVNVTIVAESTPGPVAINMSTFVGYKKAGIAGAISASFGVVLPSFVVIFLISKFLENFLEIELVARAFAGMRIAVGILILHAALNMIRKMEKNIFAYVILTVICISMLVINVFELNISSIFFMVMSGIIGIVYYGIHNSINSQRKQEGEEK